VLGFHVRGGRIRTTAILLALILIGGCASDSIVLTPEHATPASGVLASASGTLAFPTAGSLQPSADGRNFVQAAPVTIAGELTFPQGNGPFPAIVLAHGCNGNQNTERAWGPTLRSWGYATFVVDSFRSRGIDEVCVNGRTLIPLQRVPDAYGALRLLAANPKIDPQRIALMGFSHGGALTMIAATSWAKETFVPAGQPAFRAFFPFYPNCNATFPERDRVAAPLRIHTGELDDWTPARPCTELAVRLKSIGQDVTINVYPGAHHAFDQARRELFLPRVGNASNCFPRFAGILGPFPPGAARGGPPPCVKRGATVAGNSFAAEQARVNLHAQLDELMK